MIDIQKKQFEDWWDTQWICFDSDRETINSRKSCAKDGFEFGMSTVWNEVERLKKELEDARQPEVVGLNGCGYDKCPKCGGGLATFRHPGAKVNCANCGLVLQEEGGRKVYQPTPASSVLVPTIDELAEAMYQDNTALLTNVEARYIAKVVHALLTKGRGGVNG